MPIFNKNKNMESQELGSKKMNNKQVIEHENGINILQEPIVQSEVEIDNHGNSKTVQRSRNVEGDTSLIESQTNQVTATPSDAPEELGKKMVENKDKNSDIATNRYPNSSPDNHENRGNL